MTKKLSNEERIKELEKTASFLLTSCSELLKHIKFNSTTDERVIDKLDKVVDLIRDINGDYDEIIDTLNNLRESLGAKRKKLIKKLKKSTIIPIPNVRYIS